MPKGSLNKLFGTNPAAEVAGIWIDYAEGVSMKIARTGGANTEYASYLANQLLPHKFQLDRGTLPGEKFREILIGAFANCVLKDWKGVTDCKGKPVEFSVENAKKVLAEYPELFNDLQAHANNYRRFAQETLEETAKN